MKACKSLKSVLMITAAALGATGAAMIVDRPAYAQEAARTYNIPAQDLNGALREFAMQTGRDVLYAPEIVAGRSSPGARGRLSERQALSEILAGTGLTIQVTASGGYAIVGGGRPSQDAGGEVVATLPEILVEGGRSLNTDVRRTEDDVLPYVTFSREEIQQSQASNVEDFLRGRLTMGSDRGTGARNDPENNTSGNRSSINLRGLGSNQTLILVNGRRAAGVLPARGADLAQPDINGIPIASIERIEVLPGTASGIYGGGATGGVINIILRKDYSGTELQLTYDNTFDTDSARRRIDLSTGFSLEDGRTQVMLSGSYSNGNDLLAMDRNFIGPARERAYQNAPAWFLERAMLHGSRATNFKSFFGTPLTLLDGTPYGSSFGSVPNGYAGGDGGAGLLPGAGVLDLTLPQGAGAQQQSLSAVPENQALNLTLRRDMTEAVHAYLDLSATKTTSAIRQGRSAQMLLAGGQVGNPFQDYVTVFMPDPALDTGTTVETGTQRVNGGLIVDLPHGWTAGLDLNWNRATNAFDQGGGTIDSFLVSDAVAAGTIDPFRDVLLFPIDYSSYLRSQITPLPRSPSYMTDYALRVAGPLFSLPAGQVRMTALASQRREEAPDLETDYGPDFVSDRYGYYHPRSQKVDSVYVEALVPLFSEAQDFFLLHSLEAQLSTRWDRYLTTTSPEVFRTGPNSAVPDPLEVTNTLESTDYTVGIKYMPIADLAIRASYATGFLPPALTQLMPVEIPIPMVYRDPKRGNTRSFTPMIVTQAGNPDAGPEQSTSESLGLIYTPSFVKGLRLSVDYFRIEKTDELVSIDAFTILQNEALFPDRVTRGSNLPGDPAGWAPVVTAIDASLMNVAGSTLEATDIQVDYQRDIGDLGWFRFYAVGTFQSTMSRQLTSTSPVVDRVGYLDGPVELRLNAGVDWQRGPWSLALNTQYYDDYKVFVSNETVPFQQTYAQMQGSSTIPSQTYTDISGRYIFERGWLAGAQVSVGIRNLFNQEPPLVATGNLSGGYSTFGDPRLRTYSISIRKSF